MPPDTSWMDALPAVTLPGQQGAPPTPPDHDPNPLPSGTTYSDFAPVVDSTKYSPTTPRGEPGSGYMRVSAPGTVEGNSAGSPGQTGASMDAGPNAAASKADTAWMDAMPAVALPKDSASQTAPSDSGAGKNFLAGAAEGAGGMIDTLGQLGGGGLVNTLQDLAGHPQPGALRAIQEIGGTGQIVPQGQGERLARAAGVGLGSSIIPGGEGGIFRTLGNVATNMAGATAGQELSDSVPAPFKAIANIGGSLIGGSVPIAGEAAVRGASNVARPMASNFLAPLTEAGQQGLAASRIAGAATDADAVRARLAAAANADAALPAAQAVMADPNTTPAQKAAAQAQIDAHSPNRTEPVPGSAPTTYQLTGDQGLGGLERAVAKDNPEQFLGRAAQQNSARVGAIDALAPATASPEAIGTAFRSHLAHIDAQGEQAVGAARQGAQQATAGLGGAVPAGVDQQTSALQRFGQRVRAPLSDANGNARAAVSRLYDAVDPGGTLAVDMRGIRSAARSIAKDMPKNAAPLEGDAGSILGVAQMQPKVQTFKEVAALRSRITDAMRTELYANGRSQTHRRLTQLLAAVDDTLSHGVEEAAANDSAVGDRLRDIAGEGDGGSVSGGPGGLRDGATAGGGTAGVPGQGGADRQGTAGRGNAGGSGAMAPAGAVEGFPADLSDFERSLYEGLQPKAQEEPDLTPNFDADAAARMRTANAGHAERVRTFDEAPGVGAVLATGKRAGEYKMGDSQVAATIFNSGKGAAERIRALVKASGNSPAAINAIKDYAAFDFRRAAEDADGTINQAEAQKWLAAHAEAMQAFPDLAKKFETAGTARAALDEIASKHRADRTAFEKSAAADFLGDADPVQRMGKILRSDKSQATMRELARLTGGNPDARAGLQAAVIEHIKNELRSNALAGDTDVRQLKADAFLTFLRRSEPALREIFTPEQVQSIKDIGADLQRAQRSYMATKLPNGSNTAQDLAAGAHHGGGKPSMIGGLAAMEAAGELAGHVGTHLSGPIGYLVGKIGGTIGVPILQAMRAQGMHRVDELVTQAMLHPELARALLAKVPAGHFATPVIKNAARQIMALSANAAARTAMGPHE